MSVLSSIIVASLAVSLISLLGAVLPVWEKLTVKKLSTYLVAFAAGVMLTTAFIDLLPEALEHNTFENIYIYGLLGIIVFFLIERFFIWFHHHDKMHVEPTAYLVLLGDGLHNFFDGLEKLTGKRVVIGASPKYHYNGHEYQGRDIVYNKTVELTAKADMVIVHTTSAVDYAIMMHKPIIFLVVEGFSDKIIEELQSFARALKRPVVNSRECIDTGRMNELSNVDREVYDTYINNYLTTEVFDVSFNEIIINKMRERNGVR